MTPSTIIQRAAADGVRLVLSATGTIKATGDDVAVGRWLPVIREHKSALVKVMLEDGALTGDLTAIRAWLAFIGENDPAIIADTLARCEQDPEVRSYFTGRAAADLHQSGSFTSEGNHHG